MNFLLSDTFAESLARLTGDEQKAVKTTAFDLQMNPAAPGMQFHRLDKAKDRNFWSVRVSRDVRLIVHRTQASLLLAYVGHHDVAYQWAERRRLETHPKTGAAQWVEVRERVEEVVVPKYVEDVVEQAAKPPIFASVSGDELLSCGVPLEWLEEVRRVTDDGLLELCQHLPGEAAEALLDLATGAVPAKLRRAPLEEERVAADERVADDARYPASLASAAPPPQAVLDAEAFEHPDARRRFRTVANVEELERALEYSWEKWTVFLHPAQREAVEKDYGGPARVSGSAGTGKTIVALHRAVFLARANPDARVLLTTFSGTLANALRVKLRRLIGNEPRIAERLEVHSINAMARRLYDLNVGRSQIASTEVVRGLLKDAAEGGATPKVSLRFLMTEWHDVVDAWQLENWESYRDVARLGRKTRLPETQRAALWAMFSRVREALATRGLETYPGLLSRVTGYLATLKRPPFDHVVVDEAQDVSGSSRPWEQAVRTACSSRGTWANGSSSSPSPGRRSASRFAGGPGSCGSTTEPRIRSVLGPIGCWARSWRTWMGSRRTGGAPGRSSTGRSPRSRCWIRPNRRERRSDGGSLPGSRKESKPKS